MPIIFCPSNDDQHASFPHRLVIIPASKTIIRDIHTRKRFIVLRDQVTYVICSHCDHSISRAVPSCKCRYKCHDEARENAAIEAAERHETREEIVTIALPRSAQQAV